jgi:hypothetical protein
MKQKSSFCERCERMTLFQKRGINHVLHLILSVPTLGLWGLVWIVLAMTKSAEPYYCSRCGWAEGYFPGELEQPLHA